MHPELLADERQVLGIEIERFAEVGPEPHAGRADVARSAPQVVDLATDLAVQPPGFCQLAGGLE
jgi:hypothetical protein